jgi:hypothetical protein
MTRKYASCECELCNEIIPKNEAHYEDIVEETGSWQGNSSGYSSNSGSSYSYNSKGGSRSSNHSSRGRRSGNSTRTYYRNRRVWFCESCYSDLLEERKEQEEKEKKMREQSRQQSNTIFLYCFYIFSALSIFVYLIS